MRRHSGPDSQPTDTEDGGAVGFDAALSLTLRHLPALEPISVPLADGLGRTTAEDHFARVDSPSADASRMDGYAVRAGDLDGAGPGHPVSLQVRGEASAGQERLPKAVPGSALRVMTGARLPAGADTVVPDEDAIPGEGRIRVLRAWKAGRHVLRRGGDVAAGERLVARGAALTPGRLGLLAAGGLDRVCVHPAPSVAIVAIGDEVLPPGAPMKAGRVYASNLVTLTALCRQLRIRVAGDLVADDAAAIRRALERFLESHDAVVTSGGTGRGQRDWTARVLDAMGWRAVYRRVRVRPAKSTAFGLLGGRPVFTLPGGPSASLAGFLALVLPGLDALAGTTRPTVPAVLATALEMRPRWARVIFGSVAVGGGRLQFFPDRGFSRLKGLAEAGAFLLLPEGRETLSCGSTVNVHLMDDRAVAAPPADWDPERGARCPEDETGRGRPVTPAG